MGYKVSRSAIADIENRRRKYISTAELSVIAWALAVPPVRLLYPALPDGDAEVVPGVHKSASQAMTWFSGETVFTPPPLASTDFADADERRAESQKASDRLVALVDGQKPVELSRQRVNLRNRRRSMGEVLAYLQEELPEAAPTILREIETIQHYLKETERELRMLPDAVVSDEPADDLSGEKFSNPYVTLPKMTQQQGNSKQ
ncbi:hypothetical protein CRH09_00050 [Nocardia terpenica]|uniref:HTH cro/C1-type domain-containing protein n=1 Tax=Nocardia terpenica TaxID=455432 RepID=A0A291RBX4_9NOCA|nr:hypothetical protein CRH09_00050 [Nocardia terpenica]